MNLEVTVTRVPETEQISVKFSPDPDTWRYVGEGTRETLREQLTAELDALVDKLPDDESLLQHMQYRAKMRVLLWAVQGLIELP